MFRQIVEANVLAKALAIACDLKVIGKKVRQSCGSSHVNRCRKRFMVLADLVSLCDLQLIE